MPRDDGGPAFPTAPGGTDGMSLRDVYAIGALIGLLARGQHLIGDAIKVSFRVADDALAERDKPRS